MHCARAARVNPRRPIPDPILGGAESGLAGRPRRGTMGEDCHPRPCRSAAAVAVGIGGAASLVVAAGALPASPKTLWCANCLQLTPTARISRPAGRLSTAPVGRAARRLLGVPRRPPGGACLAASVLAACPCLPRRPSSPPWRSRPSAARAARCPAFVSRLNANWQKTWALCQLNWQTTSCFARVAIGKRPCVLPSAIGKRPCILPVRILPVGKMNWQKKRF